MSDDHEQSAVAAIRRRVREGRWAILASLVAGLAFWTLGLLSSSTHNDDDITRYLNTRAAAGSWDQVLGLWNRPAFVLAYFLPARLGYWAVEAQTAILSAATCYLTYRAGRGFGWKHSLLAIPFVAMQPFFLALSFSALVEPLAAFLLAASLAALASGKHRTSALFMALAPLARLELIALSLPWAFAYLWRSPGGGEIRSKVQAWSALALLPVGVLLWNLAGLIHTGDPLFLAHQAFTGEARTYAAVGPLHYVAGYIFVVGPVVFALSILGIVETVRQRERLVLASGLLLMLALYTWLSMASSAGQAAGFLRHLVTVAPLTALLAVRGFAAFSATPPARWVLAALGALTALTGLFLSVGLRQGIWLGEERDFEKLIVVAALTATLAARFVTTRGRGSDGRVRARRGDEGSLAAGARLAVLVAVLAVGFAALHPPVTHLTPEQRTIREAAARVSRHLDPDRPLLANHAWLFFYLGVDPTDPRVVRTLTRAALAEAPPGTFALWDGHYSHRLGGDVAAEEVGRLGDWRLHERFLDRETGFFAVLIEKLTAAERAGRFGPEGWVNPGHGLQWSGLIAQSDWDWETQHEGMHLLQGTHRSSGSLEGASVYLNLVRLVSLGDTETFPTRVESELRRNPAVIVDRSESIGAWHIVWGREGDETLFLATRMVEGRPEAIQLSGYCPPAAATAMHEQLVRWLPSLGPMARRASVEG